MAYIVYKQVKGRRYAYLQRSYRVSKKVKTKSQYLGPVAVALAMLGGVALTNPPGGRSRGERKKAADYRKSDTAARREKMGTGKTMEQEAWELYGKDPRKMRPRDRAVYDAWQRKESMMSRDEWERHIAWVKVQLAEEKAAASSGAAPQPQASQSDEAPDD